MFILASGWTILLSIAIVAVSVLLIGLVLLQKNRGSGLSGAFGGVGGHSAFGTKTGDFLTWLTVGLTVLFLLLNVVGNYAFEPEHITPRATPEQSSELPELPDDGAADAPAPVTVTPPATTTTPPVPASTPPAQTNTQTPAGGTNATPSGSASPDTTNTTGTTTPPPNP